jgi:hypothetical protein
MIAAFITFAAGEGDRELSWPARRCEGQLWSSDSKTVSSTDTPGRSMRS